MTWKLRGYIRRRVSLRALDSMGGRAEWGSCVSEEER